MHRLRTVTSLDVSAVAGHHAMPAALLFYFKDMFSLPGVWFPAHSNVTCTGKGLLLLHCCFTSTVNIEGLVGTVS